MKATFSLIVLMVLSVYIAYGVSQNRDVEIKNQIPSTPNRSKSDEYKFDYKIYTIPDTSKLELVSNLDTRLSTNEIQGCSFVVNGGFYDTDFTHLGLFISDNEMISNYRSNRTHDGMLTIDDGLAAIEVAKPTYTQYALQSGPLIKLDGEYTNLNITNDKNARRVLAATTNDGRLIFFIIFDSESRLLGPTLTELPTVVSQIEKLENSTFSDVINLDGGGASTFINDEAKVVESSLIGSYFCLRE